MKAHWFLRAVACLLLLSTFTYTTGPQAAAAQGNPAQEILQLINNYRAANGLHLYQYNSALAAAAQNHANWMSQTGRYTHTGAGGSTPQTRAAAAGYPGYATENIVGGTSMTPQRGLIWWQNSGVHNATLLSTRYVDAGVGFATDGNQNFYVLVVGRPDGFSPPATAAPAARPLIITPIQLAEPREDGSIVHVVQPGQALWSLGAHYGVRLADLLLLNNLSENAFLQPGQEILIRLADGAEPPPTPTPPLSHIVQRGQTLWTIAAVNRVRLADILWLNNLTEESVLQPGQEIKLYLAPGEAPPPTPTPISHHIVRTGQTLWDIALSYGLSLEQLLALNGNISAATIIRPGDELRIRPADPTPTATPSPTPAPATVVPLPPATTAVGQVDIATATGTPLPRPTATLATTLQNPPPDSDADLATTTAAAILLGVAALIAAAFAWTSRR
jgi:LysM repeat protein